MRKSNRTLALAALLFLPLFFVGCSSGKVTLTVSPSSATLQVGQTQQLTVTATQSGKSEQTVTKLVAWTSSATSVANVSQSGLVTANGPGTATITASSSGATVSATITVTGEVAMPDAGPAPADMGTADMAMAIPAPVIVDITPQRGPEAGGTSVVVTGSHLSGATGVLFGTTPATSFTVNSDTQITTVSPAGTGGINITVVTPGGTSNGLAFGYGTAPVITAITPHIGLSAGGDTVTLNGSGFTGVTTVTFDTTAATSFTVVSDSKITVVTPAHADGAVPVVVTSPLATSNASTFTYGEAPTLTSLSQTNGSAAGGNIITLTGTHLSGATAVSFGTLVVSTITMASDTQLTVTTPVHAPGSVSVTVTTPFGVTNGITFNYGYVPSLGSDIPSFGPTAGGSSVVLSGLHLSNTTSVLFGTTPAMSFSVKSDTQIVAVAPAGTSSVNITAVNAYGTSNGLAFAYGNAPTITSLNPSVGLISGNTKVVITGTSFKNVMAVSFGSAGAVSYNVDSTTQITAVSPAQSAGPVQVTVVTMYGTSNGSTFTYGDVPSISSVTPATGPTVGGNSVVIAGSNLTGVTSVTFGSASAFFSINDDTQITATAPAGAVGSVSIVATNAYGASTSLSYTYGLPPTLTSISPKNGPTDGSTTVTLTGTKFSNASGVTFGGVAAQSFNITSDTSMTAVSPAGTGSVDVVVTSLYGSSGAVTFTYGSAPTIATITPASGGLAGGNTITIDGTAFTSATTVSFGSSTLTPSSITSTELTVLAPGGSAGPVNVSVTSEFGSSNPVTYTYGAAPTVSSINPTSGPSTGGNNVTLTGTNLGQTSDVSFGGTSGSIVSVSNTQVVVAPAGGTAGSVSVVLTTPFGTTTTLYTYVDAPTIASISPSSGSTTGGTTVTITGTNFTVSSTVSIGGTNVSNVTVNSATSLTVTTPAHSAGMVDVVVTTEGGSATLSSGFTYSSSTGCNLGTATATLSSAFDSPIEFDGVGFSGLGYASSATSVNLCFATDCTQTFQAYTLNDMLTVTDTNITGTVSLPPFCIAVCDSTGATCTNAVLLQ